MPGWIIQGVRGEGKSLCAVGKIKDYLSRGRPVATNLDLYLEHLVDDDNSTLVYRLPDYPRSQDFHALPSAYDPRYKLEDRNGLLVLDESIIWLNSKNYKAPDREAILNWLILSRKDHWDLIFLCQNHESIDKTARTSLCDYLVQASRSDRTKDGFFSTLRYLFLYQKIKPTVHHYEVYYGFSFANPPDDSWEFTGTDLYDAYDTNQKFRDGTEILNGKSVDMRALYTFLPASYLSKHVYKEPLQKQLDYINKIEFIEPAQPDFTEDTAMAKLGRQTKKDLSKSKIILLLLVGSCFLTYRFFTKEEHITADSSVLNTVVSTQKAIDPLLSSAPVLLKHSAVHRVTFVDSLLSDYTPRLSAYVHSKTKQYGVIEFYQGSVVVERFRIKELHALGVAVVHKPYGVDLVTSSGSTVVTSWAISNNKKNNKPVVNKISDALSF